MKLPMVLPVRSYVRLSLPDIVPDAVTEHISPVVTDKLHDPERDIVILSTLLLKSIVPIYVPVG
jgi:hypothetical protein